MRIAHGDLALMPRALLFARVSTSDRGQTTESQLLALRDTAKRLGWEIVGELPTEVSAWNKDSARAVRKQALSAIRKQRADILAVWSLDRICRSGIRDSFALLAELEQHLGVAFYSYQEPFLSTATADQATRPLLLSLFAWMAEQESARKSERIRAYAELKRQHCYAIGSVPKWARGRMVTNAQINEIHILSESDFSIRDITRQIGVPKSTVARVLNAYKEAPMGQRAS